MRRTCHDVLLMLQILSDLVIPYNIPDHKFRGSQTKVHPQTSPWAIAKVHELCFMMHCLQVIQHKSFRIVFQRTIVVPWIPMDRSHMNHHWCTFGDFNGLFVFGMIQFKVLGTLPDYHGEWWTKSNGFWKGLNMN